MLRLERKLRNSLPLLNITIVVKRFFISVHRSFKQVLKAACLSCYPLSAESAEAEG
jgi:hypothetical protein